MRRGGLPLALALALLASGAVGGAPERLRIRGSDTMLPLLVLWADGFMAAHPGVVVEIEGGGTGTGIRALIRGNVDLASASRPLRAEEARGLLERQGSLGYAVLTARDALSVYVHPSNPVHDLSLAQVRAIFTGEIHNWKEVGGHDARIQILGRNPASGTHGFFAEHVLQGEEYTRQARVRPTTAGIVKTVQEDPAAIGYGGIGYAKEVRACHLEGVAPTAENVRRGKYPVSRYLYLYTAQPPAGLVQVFIDWVLGPEGQGLVPEAGYVALYEPTELGVVP